MATNMQTKILKAIEERVPEGLETVVQPEWANTGTLYIMDGLETKLTIRYGFQDGSCSFALDGPTFTKGSVNFGFIKYDEGDRLKALVETIGSLCEQVKS